MEEKVIEVLKQLGFSVEVIEDFGYGFNYEGTHYLFIPNADDVDFLNITIPGIYNMKGKDSFKPMELMNKVNASLKYIKAYEFEDGIWLFYERELFGEEDLMTIIPRMIIRLEQAFVLCKKLFVSMQEEDEADIVEEADEVDETDNENNE